MNTEAFRKTDPRFQFHVLMDDEKRGFEDVLKTEWLYDFEKDRYVSTRNGRIVTARILHPVMDSIMLERVGLLMRDVPIHPAKQNRGDHLFHTLMRY